MTSHLPTGRHARAGLLSLVCALALGSIMLVPEPHAAGVPDSPTGLTAIALSGQVGLAWKPSSGATSYQLYRGTTAASITTLVTPAGYTGTTFTDTGRTNNTTYYYAVKATSSSGQSLADQIAQAKPVAASCSTGNAIRVENCFPGTTSWKSTPGATGQDGGGIEGYRSAPSVNAGRQRRPEVSTANRRGLPHRDLPHRRLRRRRRGA